MLYCALIGNLYGFMIYCPFASVGVTVVSIFVKGVVYYVYIEQSCYRICYILQLNFSHRRLYLTQLMKVSLIGETMGVVTPPPVLKRAETSLSQLETKKLILILLSMTPIFLRLSLKGREKGQARLHPLEEEEGEASVLASTILDPANFTVQLQCMLLQGC